MKQSLFLLLLALLTSSAHGQTRHDMEVVVNSVTRHFIVALPSGAPPPGGHALVLMFHGEGSGGDEAFTSSGWKEKGERETFMTVFPSSLDNCFLNDSGQPVQIARWNNGRSLERRRPGASLEDDVQFVRAMLDTLIRMFPVDRSRIYATGFSDGGTFVSKLGVEMSDVIAAIAPAFGSLHPADSSTPLRNLPISYITGTLDEETLTQHGIAAIPFSDDCMTYVGDVVNRYLGTFNLASTNTRGATDNSLTYLYRTPASTNLPWSQFSFTLWKDLTRLYPNGMNYPIAAVDYLWPFFNGHYLPSGTEPPVGSDRPPNIAPNPATDYITVAADGPIALTLITVLGQQVFTTATSGGTTIDLSLLPRGVYLARLRGRRSHSTIMLVLR